VVQSPLSHELSRRGAGLPLGRVARGLFLRLNKVPALSPLVASAGRGFRRRTERVDRRLRPACHLASAVLRRTDA
jgi:hypothetical protein